MTFESRFLTEHHSSAEFDCKIADLNRWLANEALRAQRADTARTNVWTEPESKEIRAYYAIAPTMVARVELSGGQASGYSSAIPGYLLAKLALDQSLHGQGLGGELLYDAISRIIGASQAYGGRLIVVDAIDENAAAFYTRFGFIPVKQTQDRLVMKISSARAALEVL
ncbi:GNAT family N-acetyltransferase [Amycolatopsis magusensis]|uniref:GNAT superfamily N-acetyltransferase n=1 Tax=Amycolatopsis magusensis TaxID=882444 RepID=A0ABS4PI91_9PSEU|nr:GNAT family N-acetyltransferase [Amycolatopsis magusensis]MBP2179134.1 GNAT superfamily N-acetyltransferase [Amycolatopsis magusensis]